MASTGTRDLAHASRATCALPGTPLAAASAGLDACVHCGFCLQACPTYVTLEDENDSPRGRLVLMRRMLEGEIAITDPSAAQHIDRCLGCRGCETACPSGVPYGHLLEATRATMATQRKAPLVATLVLAVFSRHRVLHAALTAARLLRATGVPKLLARVLPSRLAFPLAMLASTAPVPLRNWQRRGQRSAQRGAQTPTSDAADSAPPAPPAVSASPADRPSAALLTGCVMHGLLGHVNDATAEVMTQNGFRLMPVAGQRCCGALHAHSGDLAGARALAKANIAAFEAASPDIIVVNSAGCGAMMKEYAHLLHDEPAWSARAGAIASRVRDASEALAEVGPRPGRASVPVRVTHDAPCHQMHAQRLVQPPLRVLGAVPGLDLVPLEDSDQCCGAAGIYNLIEPAVSDAVLAPKLAHIARTGAELVATGNPGCLMQLGAGLMLSGSSARVVHPIELLAASYRE